MRFLKISFAMAALFLGACKEDVKTVQPPAGTSENFAFEIFLVDENGHPISPNQSLTLPSGYTLRPSLFKMYVSQISLIDDNGNTTLLKDVALLDPLATDENSFRLAVPAGDYKSLQVGFGVDSVLNASDPLDFERDHPLSSYQSMYWTMLKYRFAKFEGKADGPDTSNIFIAYHPGRDELYQTRTFAFEQSFSGASGTTVIASFTLDVSDLLQNIDLKSEPQTHSEGATLPIAQKFMENLADNVHLEIARLVE